MQCWLIKTRLNGYDAGRRFEASRQRGRLMNKQCAVNALWIINLHSRHGHRAPCISTGYPVVHALRPPSRYTYTRIYDSLLKSIVRGSRRETVFFLLRYKKKEERKRTQWRVKNNLSFTCTWEGSRRKRLHLPSIIFPSCSRILKIARYAPCAKKRESSRRRKRFT